MQLQQHPLTVDGEAGLLAAAVGGVRVPADELPLGEARKRTTGVGFVDVQLFCQLLVGGRGVFQLDQQMSLDGGEGQVAALLGEHAEFANQIA